MISTSCIPCAAKRAEIDRKLGFIREQAKKRAIENGITMAIYVDSEDNTLRITEAKTAIERGYKNMEIISRFDN